LRSRAEDIEPLALHFARTASEEYGLPVLSLTRQNLDDLVAHRWPGNIRELRHVIERATILARGRPIDVGALLGTRTPQAAGAAGAGEIIPLARLKKLEAASIRAALERTRGKLYGPGGAAEALGVKSSTLASRMKSLGIRK
jgi:DNA-binding NtrC family response regulator